ncbi:MAG: GGDEF domain-containing protein [Clostridiales bacterium]|nr:GGDEF domain-containing protein [Clostridiales bacterium]
MKKAIDSVTAFRKSQKKYFKDFGGEISFRNLQLMKTVCCAGIAIFCLYFAITKIFFNPWSISILYLLPVPVLGIFLFAINRYLHAKPFNVRDSAVLTLLLYIFLLAVTIILSVFPNPETPSIYYHLFMLACPVLFILPFYVHMIIAPLGYAAFAILVILFKAKAIWPHELFESFTALLFSIVVMVLMSQFRVQSDSLKSKYYEMSQTDGLTLLMNKVSGIGASEQYLAELKAGEHFAVLFLDLDDFKHINDTYGHMPGDELLRAVADTLHANCRSGDIVCRFGGDEFLIVLKSVQNESAAVAKVEKIKSQINAISLSPIPEIS